MKYFDLAYSFASFCSTHSDTCHIFNSWYSTFWHLRSLLLHNNRSLPAIISSFVQSVSPTHEVRGCVLFTAIYSAPRLVPAHNGGSIYTCEINTYPIVKA